MKTILFGDWGTKLTAALLSAVVWAALYSSSNASRSVEVPLHVGVGGGAVRVASARILVGDRAVGQWTFDPAEGDSREVGRLALQLTGAGTTLDRVVPETVVVRLDLPGERLSEEHPQGSIRVAFDERMVRGIPQAVAARLPEEAREFTVEYVLYRRQELEIDVDAARVIRGVPARGYAVGGVEAVPPRVAVWVPANREILKAPPEPVDIDGFNAGFPTPPWRLRDRPAAGQAPLVLDGEFRLRVAIGPAAEAHVDLYLPVRGVLTPSGVAPAEWRMSGDAHEQAGPDSGRPVYRVPIRLHGPSDALYAPALEADSWAIVEVPSEDYHGAVDPAWVHVVIGDERLRGLIRAEPFGKYEDAGQRTVAVSIDLRPGD